MDILLYLIPIALGMGAIGLGAFLWALKSGQFEDLDGAAHRILFEDDDIPLPPAAPTATPAPTENTHKNNRPKDGESN